MFYVFFHAPIVFAHAYVAVRIGLWPDWSDPVRVLLLALAALGFASVILVWLQFARRGYAATTLLRVQNVWLGFMFFLFTISIATDVFLWLVGQLDPGPTSPALILASALGVTALALYEGHRAPRTRRVEVELGRWPLPLDGFRIVQISDLHISTTVGRTFVEHVTSHVNALAPDLVAVTGDLVDGKEGRVGPALDPFAEIAAPHGVWFVMGNHDFYSGADDWIPRIERLGWRLLRNRRVAIGTDSEGFDLAGIDDDRGAAGTDGTDFDAALEGRDADRPIVLLAHAPRTFPRAVELGVDLQLSGHTHGGQVWPFHIAIWLQERFLKGLYRRGSSQLYVSSGTGRWGPPMRLGSRSEITELVLRSPRDEGRPLPEAGSRNARGVPGARFVA